MKLTQRNSYATLFLAVGGVAAISLAISRAPAAAWALDSLAGTFALAGASIAGARLALGTPDRTVRRLWQFALGLLILVGISEFGGPWAERLERRLGVEDLNDCLTLIATFAMLWLATRLDNIPIWARRILWVGFGLHALATGLEVNDDINGHGGEHARLEALSDLAQSFALQFYLLGAITFVASLRWRLFALHRSPMALGDMARSMFSSQALLHKYRYPRSWAIGLPGAKTVLSLARFVIGLIECAPVVRARFGMDHWTQLSGICTAGFRHGLDARAYYLFELYRPELMQRAAAYVTRYETKNGLFKILTWQLPKHGRRTALGDKLSVHRLCERSRIPHPPLLGIAQGGYVRLHCDEPAALDRDLFVKLVRSKGARGAERLRRTAPNVYVGGDGVEISLAELLNRLAIRSKAGPLMIQPHLANHPEIDDLASESLIAVRVITCLDEANAPAVTHGMLRVLSKLEPDWPMKTELGSPVDLETGILGLMTGDKGDTRFQWFADHPVTGVPVLGRTLPHWPEIRAVALAAHLACPDRLLVGWDIALTPDGAVLLEGNAYPDVDFLQRVHRCPLGASPMGPLLYARLIELRQRMSGGTVRGSDDFD
jgi:hypothetical protein